MKASKVASNSARRLAATMLIVACGAGSLSAQQAGAVDPFHRVPGFQLPLADQPLPQPTLNPANPALHAGAGESAAEDAAESSAWQTQPPPAQPPQRDFRQDVPQSRYNDLPPHHRPGDQGPHRRPSGNPPAISSRQSTFAIPFSVSQPAGGEPAPQEVQLFVADPANPQWRLDSRVAPADGRFLFRAPRDGEYWFQVRTIDANGQLIGPPAREPGLRVLVDTTAPRLDIQTQMLIDGRLEISWTVNDTHLAPGSIKLEHQLASNAPWQPIPGLDIGAASQQNSPESTSGMFVWPLGVSEGAISIRGEAADTAGNRNVVLRRVHVTEQLTKLREQQRQAELDRQQQVAAGAGRHPQQSFAGYSPTQPPGAAGQASRPRADGGVRADGSQVWPADGNAYQPPMRPNDQHRPPLADLPRDQPRTDGQFWSASDGGPRPAAAHPQIGRQYRTEDAPPAAAPPATEPGPHAPRYVRSKSFLLDYGVDSLTGMKKRILLWATRDGGRTWERFGEDPDGQSPFEVTVAEPGLYGFSIVAEGADARQEYIPRSGEPAQSWIMVDPDPPKARLTSVQLDPDGESAQLRIRWEAFDENLLDRPVSIFLSDRPDGQWFRIAGDLANSGQYNWRLDDGLPPEIYLRLVVRDAAGNVAEHIGEKPIRLDDLRPAVQIRGVRSSQRPPQQILILQ